MAAVAGSVVGQAVRPDAHGRDYQPIGVRGAPPAPIAHPFYEPRPRRGRASAIAVRAALEAAHWRPNGPSAAVDRGSGGPIGAADGKNGPTRPRPDAHRPHWLSCLRCIRIEVRRGRVAEGRAGVVVVSRRLVRAMARRFQFAGPGRARLAGAGLARLEVGWERGGAGRGPQQAPPLDVATDAPVELRATGSANLPGAVSAPIDVAGPELDEPPPTERHAVDVLPSPTGLLRGQVVDARTGQGLPFVEVAPYSLGQKPSSSVQADGEGRFELRRPWVRSTSRSRAIA